jgi:hypothetical protein
MSDKMDEALTSFLAEHQTSRADFFQSVREEWAINPMLAGEMLVDLVRAEHDRYLKACGSRGGTLEGFKAHLRACEQADPHRWFLATFNEWIQREAKRAD